MATGKQLCQEVAGKDPNNVRIRYLLFELIIRSHEYQELEKMVADADRVLNEMETAAAAGRCGLRRGDALDHRSKGNDPELWPRR